MIKKFSKTIIVDGKIFMAYAICVKKDLNVTPQENTLS
jgi:hypothetical protein